VPGLPRQDVSVAEQDTMTQVTNQKITDGTLIAIKTSKLVFTARWRSW
jgi:hypothetical protein